MLNRRAFHLIGYGMYIVTSRKDEKINGCIVNTLMQISSEPPTVAISVNKTNLTHEYIAASKVFTATVLKQETPLKFMGRFGFNSGRTFDKFQGVNYKLGENNTPIVTDYALAYFEAKVINQIDVATHTVFVGEITATDILSQGEPLTYAYYHQVKRGATPKAAPSYIEEEKMEARAGERYRCRVCGYIYDPALGDPDGGIKPGTSFEDIPDTWVCPVCGADKSSFEKLND